MKQTHISSHVLIVALATLTMLTNAHKSEAQAQQAAQRAAPEKARSIQQNMASVAHVLNQYVEFPSRDAFEISLDMTVEFEMLPGNIAWLYMMYGDLPALVDKIIMPQVLSITRNKGSEYQAKDFIMGDGREKFQKDITDALSKVLAEKKIVIHNALIRHVEVPSMILEPIQKAGLAGEQDLTNKERQNTAKRMAELNTEMTLIEQKREQVAQETRKLKAEIEADQLKQVAEIEAEAMKSVAEIGKETAAIYAGRTRTLGQAQADSVKLVEGEKARGFQLKTEAFGDPSAFNLWEFASSLNPDMKVNILHAGQGTLWTDIEKAKMGELGGATVITK